METPIWVADLWSLSGDHCSMARFRWNFHDQWTGRALKALARYPAGKIHPLKSALIFKGLMYYPESPNWLRKKGKKHHIWMLKPVFSPSKNLDPQATACRHSLELSPQRIPPFHVEDAEKMQKRCGPVVDCRHSQPGWKNRDDSTFRSSADEESQDASRFGSRSLKSLDHLVSWDMWVYHGLSRTGLWVYPGHIPQFMATLMRNMSFFSNHRILGSCERQLHLTICMCEWNTCCIFHDHVMICHDISWRVVVSTSSKFAESCAFSCGPNSQILGRKGSPLST